MNDEDIFSVRPEKAIAYLKKKGLAPAFRWTDLWKEDHDTALTVAKMMDVELLQDVKDALVDALENGETMQDFTDKIYPLMEAKGWIGWKETVDPDTGEVVEAELGTPRRVELIFRQNMGVAYEKGRWEEAQETKEEFPMMRYVATQDMRTRDEHAAWDGITLPIDHEFWKTHAPKNGWNCRCSVIQLTKEDSQKLGGVKPAPKITYYEATNPRTGKTEQVPDGIDFGWDYNPGTASDARLEKDLKEREAEFYAD